MSATVSAIVVNYNAGACLARSVTALARSAAGLEIIVVDNASGDDSLAQLAAVADIGPLQVISTGANLGFAAGVNRGLAAATGEFILLVNPDCFVSVGAVDQLATALAADPRAAIAGGLVFDPDGSEQRGCRRREPTPARSLLEFLPAMIARRLARGGERVSLNHTPLPAVPVGADAVSGSFMLLRRTLLDRTGGLDERYFLHCEDLDICHLARQGGERVLFVPAATALHLKGVSSRATPLAVEQYKHRAMWLYFDKYYRQNTSLAVCGLVKGGIAAHYALLAMRARVGRLRRRPAPATLQDLPHIVPAVRTVDSAPRQILVAGGRSETGAHLIDQLLRGGYRVLAGSRRPPLAVDSALHWWNWEYFLKAPRAEIGPIDALIWVAPLWAFEPLSAIAARLMIPRLVVVGSASVVTKALNGEPREAVVVQRLRSAEQFFWRFCAARSAHGTLFRPTMIYGERRNKNLYRLRRLVRLFGVIPVCGSGAGLRQPVHAADVAGACIAALDCERSHGCTYDLAGPTPIPWRTVVGSAFSAEGRFVRPLAVPRRVLRAGLALARYVPGCGDLTPAMADRGDLDLVQSPRRAMADFGFAPRPFGLSDSAR